MDRLPNGARPRPRASASLRPGDHRAAQRASAADRDLVRRRPERDRIYVLSEAATTPTGPKLRRNWVVRVKIDGRSYAGVAIEIEGDQDDALARRLLAAKYQGWW